ncbi:MAG: DUF1476 domain-containing protein [Alphaproteobacteria bacterium]|nr:DUF1476 domain-containing protein [Alphaproteobacteria bacterium]
MTTFNEREKGFESKYKHDQETQFKMTARRNKLLGLWAAEKMGMTGAAAEANAKDVVVADFDKPGDDDVIGKVLKDLGAKGVKMGETDLRREMERLAAVARDQITREAKPDSPQQV